MRAVTPYLISNKCAIAWGKYVHDQVRLGETITKENIIKTISTLEQYTDLCLTVTETLPSSLIEATSNLPPGDETITIPAHQADVQIQTISEGDPILASSETFTIPTLLGDVKMRSSTTLGDQSTVPLRPSSKTRAK